MTTKAPDEPIRRVTIQGGNGFLGPATVEEMRDKGFQLLVTDVAPYGRTGADGKQLGRVDGGTGDQPEAAAGGASADAYILRPPHRSSVVDATDIAAVKLSALSSDCIVNLAVVRPHRQLAFDVNCRGTYNAVKSACDARHARFINTGPHVSFCLHVCIVNLCAVSCTKLSSFVTACLTVSLCAVSSHTLGIPTPALPMTSRKKFQVTLALGYTSYLRAAVMRFVASMLPTITSLY